MYLQCIPEKIFYSFIPESFLNRRILTLDSYSGTPLMPAQWMSGLVNVRKRSYPLRIPSNLLLDWESQLLLKVVLDNRMAQIWVVLEDSGSRLRRALIFHPLPTAKTLLPTVYMMELKSKHVTYITSFSFVTLTCGQKAFLSDLLRNTSNSASSDLNTHISPEQLVA